MFKILITDTAGETQSYPMLVDGVAKLFNNLDSANKFCETLNRIAREENASWRYVAAPLTEQEARLVQTLMQQGMHVHVSK